MNIPEDSVMLLSFINTKLRDEYSSLKELCSSMDIDEAQLRDKLKKAGYVYQQAANQFK